MNIVHQFDQMPPGLDDQRFEPSLKKVARFPSESVESLCEGSLKPLHAGRQITAPSTNAQMEMIRHQHIGQKIPLEAFAGFPKDRLERLLRSVGLEDERTVIAAVYDVVETVGCFYSVLSRH